MGVAVAVFLERRHHRRLPQATHRRYGPPRRLCQRWRQ
jgi:hypothetical protein